MKNSPRLLLLLPLALCLSSLPARPAAAGEFPRRPVLTTAPDGSLFGGCQIVDGSDGEFELFRLAKDSGPDGVVWLGRFNGRLAGVAASPEGGLLALTRDGALAVHGDDPAMLANPDDRWNMLDLAWFGDGPAALDYDGQQLRLVRPTDSMTWGAPEGIAADNRVAKAVLVPAGDELHLLWSALSRDLSRGALRHAVRRAGGWRELDPVPLGDSVAFTAFKRGDGRLALVALVPPLLGDGGTKLAAKLWDGDSWSGDDGFALALTALSPVPLNIAGAASGGGSAFLATGENGLSLGSVDHKGRAGAFASIRPVSRRGIDADWSALTSLGLIAAFVVLLLVYCRRSRMLSLALPGRPPDLTSRAVALAVDWLLVSIGLTAYHVAAGDLRIYTELMTLGEVNAIFWLTLGSLALFCAVMEAFSGATPGKRLAGIRVRSVLGGPPSTLQALLRNAMRVVDMFPMVFPGILGAVAAMFNPRRQRVGDMLAATILRRHAPLDKRAFILASASPRRRELMEALGLNIRVEPAEIDEDAIRGTSPEATARLLAEAKVRASMERVGPAAEVVVAADTVVVLDDKILGKPRDAQEAVDMLTRLSGRSHRVLTGVMIWDPATGQGLSDVEETEVEFRNLTPKEIYDYVATGDPLDKAGAYGVQSGHLVKQIRGSLSNVAGLPMEKLWGMLAMLDS